MKIVHFEVPVDDQKRAAKFFEQAFDWKIKKWQSEDFDYWTIETGDPDQAGIDGGMQKRDNPQQGIVNSIDVKDIHEAKDKVTSAGGTITVPILAVPHVGWMFYFKDTESNTWCAFQTDRQAK